jgi:CspA family cold shock protein
LEQSFAQPDSAFRNHPRITTIFFSRTLQLSKAVDFKSEVFSGNLIVLARFRAQLIVVIHPLAVGGILEMQLEGSREAASVKSGVVKWFSRVKGYGFISPDDGGTEVFVHYSAIKGDGYRNLHEGERVHYEEVDIGRGPQAKNVNQLRVY